MVQFTKAFGVQAGKNGGVELLVKKANKANKPASQIQSSTYGPSVSSRKSVYPAPTHEKMNRFGGTCKSGGPWTPGARCCVDSIKESKD